MEEFKLEPKSVLNQVPGWDEPTRDSLSRQIERLIPPDANEKAPETP